MARSVQFPTRMAHRSRNSHFGDLLHHEAGDGTPIRWALGGVLAFCALNAFVGGLFGMAGAVGVPLDWLRGTPFRDYSVPSVILFLVVGGSLLLAAIAVMARLRARAFAFGAGVILLAWIAVQVTLIGYVSWMQPVTALTGAWILILTTLLPRP
jgi:hypothetical protein